MSFAGNQGNIADTGRKIGILVLGIVAGCKLITYVYNPTLKYETNLAEGKKQLLSRYRGYHDERMKKFDLTASK